MFLTKNELEIMNVLWQSDTDLVRGDIIELSPHRSWRENSIHVILNALIRKGAIKVIGMKLSGKRFGRTYGPNLTKEVYLSAQVPHTTDTSNNPITCLFSALIRDTGVSEETLDELQKILDEQRRKANNS